MFTNPSNAHNAKIFEVVFPNPKFRLDILFPASDTALINELNAYPVNYSVFVNDELVAQDLIPNRVNATTTFEASGNTTNDIKNYFLPVFTKPFNRIKMVQKSGRLGNELSGEINFNISVIPNSTYPGPNIFPSIYSFSNSTAYTFILDRTGSGLIPLATTEDDFFPPLVDFPLNSLGNNNPNNPTENYLARALTFTKFFNTTGVTFQLSIEGYGENSTLADSFGTTNIGINPGPNFFRQSYFYNNGSQPSFKDSYGRLITQANYSFAQHVTEVTNPNEIYFDNLSLGTGERNRYENIQGFWNPSGVAQNDNNLAPSEINFDNGYVYFSNDPSKKVGESYFFYLITEKGHICLKITRSIGADFFEPSIEPIVVFKDIIIDITDEYFSQGTLTDQEYQNQMRSYIQTVPNPTTINNASIENIFYIDEDNSTNPPTFKAFINAETSTQFSIGSRTLNIKVIEKPVFQKIYLFAPGNYNLLDFFDLDHDLNLNYVKIVGISPSTTNLTIQEDPKFNFQVTASEILEVYVFDQKIGELNMIQGSSRTIFEKLRRKINPKNYIIGLQGQHSIREIKSIIPNGIEVYGEEFEILDEAVDHIVCSLSYGRAVLEVVIPIIVISSNVFRNFLPFGRKLEIPKLLSIPLSEREIVIIDSLGTNHSFKASSSGFPISLLVNNINNPGFKIREYSSYWEIEPRTEILIYAQYKKTSSSNVNIKQILLNAVEKFIEDGSTEIYSNLDSEGYVTLPFPQRVFFNFIRISVPVNPFDVFGPERLKLAEKRYQIFSLNYDFTFSGEALSPTVFTDTTNVFFNAIKASTRKISFVQKIRFPIMNGINSSNAPASYTTNLPFSVEPVSNPLLNFITTSSETFGTKVVNMINISTVNVQYPELDSQFLVMRKNPNISMSTDGSYEFLTFEQLPRIDLSQKIYYTDITTFREVLQFDNRRYFFSNYPLSSGLNIDLATIGNDLTDSDYDMKINDVINNGVPFPTASGLIENLFVQYGELFSKLTFAKFTGQQILETIFIESNDITGDHLHSAGLQSEFLFFPTVNSQIQKQGYTITKTTTGFKFSKTSLDVTIPEYFMVKTFGTTQETVLLIFDNIPINKLYSKIYLSQSFPNAGSLYSVSEKPVLLVNDMINSASYQTYTITSDSSGNIRINRPSLDSPLIDFYIYDGNSVNQVIFESLPTLTKNDVYLFDTTNLWNPTVPYEIVSNAILSGTNVQIVDTTKPAELKLDTTNSNLNIPGSNLIKYSDYNSAIFEFKIVQVNNITQIPILYHQNSIFVENLNPGEEITQFATDPSNFKNITEVQNLVLNHCGIHLQKTSFTITANSTGSSKLYIKRKDTSGELPPLIFRIDILPPPLPSKLSLEILNANLAPTTTDEYLINGIYNSISASIQSKITIQKVLNDTTNNPNFNLKEGKNFIYYQYYNHPVFTGSNYSELLELEVDVKLIPVPKAFTAERFLRLGQTIDISLIQEVFGETPGHSIVSISSNSAPLSAALTPANLVIDSTGKKITVNVQNTGDEGTYIFNVEYTATTISQQFLQTNVQGQIKFYIWDPSNSSIITIVKPPSTFAVIETYQDLGIDGNFDKIEYNGVELNGTKHNAIDWSKKDEISIESKSQLVDTYVLYTKDSSTDLMKVYLLNIIIIKPPASKVIFYQNGQTRNIDLINEFFPLLGDKLIDAEIDLTAGGLVSDLQNVPISSSTTSPTTYQIQIPNSSGSGTNGNFTTSSSILITTIQFTTKSISAPIVSLNPIEFLVPLNTSFEIKSTDISPDGLIVLNTGSNDSGITITQRNNSIIVFGNSTAPPSTSFTITLQKDFIISDPVSISIEFFDPNLTNHVTKVSYFNNFIYDFSGSVKSYSYENLTYQPENKIPPVPTNQPTQPNFVTVQNILDGTTKKSRVFTSKFQNVNHFIILLKMVDGTISILDVRFITPAKLSKKFFVVVRQPSEIVNASHQATIRMSDISNFSIVYDPDTGKPSNTQGFSFDNNFGNSTVTPYLEVETQFGNTAINFFSSGGLEVGIINNPIPSPASNQILATSLFSPGVWQDFVILVKATHDRESISGTIETVTTTLLSVAVDIETLSDIVVIDQDIILETGNNLDFDMQDFVVDGIGKVNFTNWNFNNTNSLPSGFISDGRFLRSTGPLTLATTYEVSVTAKSLQLSSLNKTITFKLIVFDPNNSSIQRKEAVLVEMLPYTLPFTDAISTINNQTILNNITINNVRITIGVNSLILQALANFSNDFSFEVITRDGVVNFVHVSQVQDEKNININSFEYTGQIFKTTNQTVVSYTISSDPGTKIAGTLYSLPGSGQIRINTNGEFTVQSTIPLNISVLTDSGRTITINVNGNNHQIKTIVESPPTDISLGINFLLLKINQQLVSSSLDLGYATFTIMNSNSLQITNVRSNFQQTLIQYENNNNGLIDVSSLLVDINRNPNSQIIFATVINSTVRFLTQFPIAKITYNSMDLKPNNQNISLFKQGDDKKIGSFLVSGSAVDITSESISGISRPIGLYDEETKTYLYLIVEIQNLEEEITVTPGQVITSIDTSPYMTIGLLDGSQIISAENSPLLERAEIQAGNIVILSPSLTGDFIFYGVTQNGTFMIFNIKYIHRTIVVNNINQILIAAFLGGESPPLEFIETDVSVGIRYVENPNGLTILHTSKPFYGRWTIEIR